MKLFHLSIRYNIHSIEGMNKGQTEKGEKGKIMICLAYY